ncbi:MAG: tRNA (N(6)-L-threonylcarbamoyladenosine(37)-C(2))-methylthiotransferase MtaB [Bacteroidaceae bacterium]|nr:tRNA (N(6)-L-threonylcarbamoyladenosine(37)-C(2))-methylthiotransferase MtaB [Bacteroidaceae bacterium]
MIDTSAFQNKKAAYYTLGCKLNFAETSTFGEMLASYGVTTAEKGEEADICLINTCSVTEVADRKCRQAIRRMARQHPNAFVAVTGCYAQLEGNEVAKIEGVDLVLGSNEKAQLIQILSERFSEQSVNSENEKSSNHQIVKSTNDKVLVTPKTKDITSFAPSCSRGNRTRFFLKVQDGCNHFCTYCTIPYARGFSRNASVEFLVEQAKEVAAKGGKEIVITGVNIGDFGRSTGETFFDLVKALDQVEGIERYRISSIEPELLTDDIIIYCARSKKFMPHFHIPLQSGSDTVLKLMHRRYDTALFRHKVELIKQYMPDAFIGVDVMVGCRGETPECFEECYEFLKSLDVTQLHVFPYSERPGTAALKIPYIVDEQEKKRRLNALLELSEEKTLAFYAKHLGEERLVLLEKGKGRTLSGFTDNYIKVQLKVADNKSDIAQSQQVLDNTICRVVLDEINGKKDAVIVHKV